MYLADPWSADLTSGFSHPVCHKLVQQSVSSWLSQDLFWLLWDYALSWQRHCPACFSVTLSSWTSPLRSNPLLLLLTLTSLVLATLTCGNSTLTVACYRDRAMRLLISSWEMPYQVSTVLCLHPAWAAARAGGTSASAAKWKAWTCLRSIYGTQAPRGRPQVHGWRMRVGTSKLKNTVIMPGNKAAAREKRKHVKM